jgi:hypothetical protein
VGEVIWKIFIRTYREKIETKIDVLERGKFIKKINCVKNNHLKGQKILAII